MWTTFAYDFQPLDAANEQKMDYDIKPKKQQPQYEDNSKFKNPNKSNKKNEQIEQENKFEEERENNEIDQLTHDTLNIINNKKVISRKVEIETKITYTYEDGSTKVVTQNESHDFRESNN